MLKRKAISKCFTDNFVFKLCPVTRNVRELTAIVFIIDGPSPLGALEIGGCLRLCGIWW